MEISLMGKIKTPLNFLRQFLVRALWKKSLISIFTFILSNSKNDIEVCVYLSVDTSVESGNIARARNNLRKMTLKIDLFFTPKHFRQFYREL